MPADTPQHALAHAKLNLSLRVLAREGSGYHQIETMFCGLELADEIEISRTSAGVTLDVAAPTGAIAGPTGDVTVPTRDTVAAATADLGPIEQNLAFRAARLFADATTLGQDSHIRLVKRIPAGAGMGGGSSDAAAVLSALNRMHGRPLSDAALLRLGAQLGSDVPFFLADTPLALAWGRGERIMPLPPLPAAPILLTVPPERIATAAAYAALDGVRARTPAVIHAPRSWSDVAAAAHNDFEDVIFARHPRLGALRQLLEDAGAMIARMTGTGSVVFGAFGDVASAEAAARQVARAHPDVGTIVTQTRTSG
jgi:4-diphosphocytidyl-2-C-methyl-D-erythritol kinase